MNKGDTKAQQTQGNPVNVPKLQMLGSDGSEAGSMEKIRDILFGNQMRDYEKRFTSMEENIGRELSSLREENKNRIEGIEVFFKKEMSALKDRLKGENRDRSDSEKKLLQEVKDATSSINKKITQLEEQVIENVSELREQILDQSKKLSGDILSKYHQTSNDLSMAVQELNDSKVERSALAESLLEIAMHLSGGPTVAPEEETSQE